MRQPEQLCKVTMFRYHKILVPLDGSELAEGALPLAQLLARTMAAELALLRVVPPLPITLDSGRVEEIKAARAQEADAYVKGIAARLELGNGRVVTTRYMRGPAARRILEFASDNGVDLIVLASHGHSGIGRWLHGSVATRVLRQAPCSTALVHARRPLAPRGVAQILLPLDGSPLAETAIDPAVAIAQATGAQLTLLTVTYSLGRLAPANYRQHLEQVERQEAQSQLAYLGAVRASVVEYGVPVEIARAAGAAAEEILAYSEKHTTDLIVLSSHGRTGWGRWAFGSVAEKVVRGARCATLLVRTAPSPIANGGDEQE